MIKRSRSSNTLNSACRSIAKVTDKAGSDLFRYATTDHTGLSKRLGHMPAIGLGHTVKYILLQLLLSILAAAATGALMGLMIGCGIPYLLFGTC
jgi:hypothetical protein